MGEPSRGGYHPARSRSPSPFASYSSRASSDEYSDAEGESSNGRHGGRKDGRLSPRPDDLYYEDSDVDETESTAGVSKVEAAQAVWYVR